MSWGGGAAYEFALTASSSGVLPWLMIQPIRRPLAPKSFENHRQAFKVSDRESP